MEFRDLQRQYQVLKSDIDRAMCEVAATAHYIGGSQVAELEQQLAEYVGVKHCITCANGTDALTLALKVWNVKAGDAVFVPDFTFFASAEVVALEGATPIFVDVCRDTFNIDIHDLERKIKQVISEGKLNPKVVIAVDLFGLPADFKALRKVADTYKLFVLEDGAQGFGGSIDLQRACSFGDIATTSFFPAKPLGCYGDGGAFFTNNDTWAALAASYKVHGKGKDKYENVRIGLNSRLDTLQAAILLVKLKAFKDFELEAVQHVAHAYSDLLPKGVVKPFIPEGFTSSWAQYTIQLADKQQRDRVQIDLKQQGIPSMVYYPIPMHCQQAFQPVKQDCPTTEQLCETVLSLPMHPYMTENDILNVTTKLKFLF